MGFPWAWLPDLAAVKEAKTLLGDIKVECLRPSVTRRLLRGLSVGLGVLPLQGDVGEEGVERVDGRTFQRRGDSILELWHLLL